VCKNKKSLERKSYGERPYLLGRWGINKVSKLHSEYQNFDSIGVMLYVHATSNSQLDSSTIQTSKNAFFQLRRCSQMLQWTANFILYGLSWFCSVWQCMDIWLVECCTSSVKRFHVSDVSTEMEIISFTAGTVSSSPSS
jgi:hypothetical protein